MQKSVKKYIKLELLKTEKENKFTKNRDDKSNEIVWRIPYEQAKKSF